MVACTEMRAVGDEGYQPIYDASNMIGHRIEESRQIDAQPHDLNALLVTKHGELPEVVRHQYRHDKQDDVVVGMKSFFYFDPIRHSKH